MKISISNSMATFLDGSDEEADWLEYLLSISEPTFRRNYKSGRTENTGTDRTTFFKRGQFPAGFIRIVWSAAKKEGYEVELVDDRVKPDFEPIEYTGPVVKTLEEEQSLRQEGCTYWRRYYQQDAIITTGKRRRGILWHPTAAGKTEAAVGLTMDYPISWVFLVRSKDLLWNAVDRYEKRTGLTANYIGDGKVSLEGTGNFTVISVQTLSRRKEDEQLWAIVRNAAGIIIDEAHETPASTLYDITLAAENAYYRVGLSGTPLSRTDQKGMLTIGALGPVIHRVRTDELIGKGFLSQPTIDMRECYQESKRLTWPGVYKDIVVNSTKRNNLLVEMMGESTFPNFTFVTHENHGTQLQKRAKKAGINAEFIWGTKSTKMRDAALERLARTDTDAIICTAVFQQGIDFEDLASIVIGTGGKSAIATLQRLGRGMRIGEDGNKKTFELRDVLDTGNKWTEKHAKIRRKDYMSEGHKVTTIEEGEE